MTERNAVRNNPEHYEEDLKKYLLPALRHHFTHASDFTACESCPYGPEGSLHDACSNIMIDLLPDVLRSFPDPLSSALADRLDLCRQYEYDTCSACPYFDRCYAEEDLDPVLEDVFNHLRSVGAYQRL